MALIILRIIFVAVAAGIGVLLIPKEPLSQPWQAWVIFGGVLAVALATICIDILLPRKRLDTITSVYFGLLVGLFLTFVADLALNALQLSPVLRHRVTLVLGMILCYSCISLLMQTKNDFRFIIPYVEFSRDVKETRPYLLDTSVVIDGRIADLIGTNLLDAKLVMPGFVLAELQSIADSADRVKRARGRRGLDILHRLRADRHVDLEVYERELPEMSGQPVDMKLVLLAKNLDGRILTTDANLNKVARLHGVNAINLNELANAVKPAFLPGDRIDLELVKPGEEPGQGVGYLDDGTMVVVEGGRDHLQQSVCVTVTSVLQTAGGRMVFGRIDGGGPREASSVRSSPAARR